MISEILPIIFFCCGVIEWIALNELNPALVKVGLPIVGPLSEELPLPVLNATLKGGQKQRRLRWTDVRIALEINNFTG